MAIKCSTCCTAFSTYGDLVAHIRTAKHPPGKLDKSTNDENENATLVESLDKLQITGNGKYLGADNRANTRTARKKTKYKANKFKGNNSKKFTVFTAGDANSQIVESCMKKLLPPPKPRMSFASFDDYCRHFATLTFLQDIADNQDFITARPDFDIEWSYCQERRATDYSIILRGDSKLVKKIQDPDMKCLVRNPFLAGQAIFMFDKNRELWCGFVTTSYVEVKDQVDETEDECGNVVPRVIPATTREEDITIHLNISLYPWVSTPLPTVQLTDNLEFVPASVQASRMLRAMPRIGGLILRRIILGQEPIEMDIVSARNVAFHNQLLNESQRRAVATALSNPITVLRGPPGTGKTSAIHEIVLQLLNTGRYPVLVTAASNVAVDNIAKMLLKTNPLGLMRIPAALKVQDYPEEHPLVGICFHRKLKNELPASYAAIAARVDEKNVASLDPGEFQQYCKARKKTTMDILGHSKVILATTTVAGGGAITSLGGVRTIILDEATQSSEPSTLIPLSLPGVSKFVVVGDDKQLTCMSEIPSFSMSLFERMLLNGACAEPLVLDTQYRMHPDISEFPRLKFYDGSLKDGIGLERRQMAGITSPLHFWDTDGGAPESAIKQKRKSKGFTYVNLFEVAYLLVDPIINRDGDALKVEVDIVDKRVKGVKMATVYIVAGTMIATVDAFQGREKDVMVMSCVRSNYTGQIGFLKDERRLNVALTRARHSMIFIGHVECLKRGSKVWRQYLDFLRSKCAIHNEAEFVY
ncbi:putative ATP-dependent RNA helicase ECM32 [Candida viswanathii]|uniref:Putative ATP-dependent RNA helicase ECM32 n=1 Tax=Candida viswanathii TaxID=5486 RepID=A0A367YCT4_9ASCO|nr:putative ATP-dependent RNA helicase ECM32 [Candida viswanathii]